MVIEIVAINSMVIFHSYVNVYQRVSIGKRDSINQQKVEINTNHQEQGFMGDTVNLRQSILWDPHWKWGLRMSSSY